MNKFKRLFALLLALAMVFALVACGEKDEEDEKKSKEEKFLSEVEDLMDEIIEAIEDGDQDKAEELYKELDDLEDEYNEILEELEEDDEDKAEQFEKDFEKLFDKFEERQEEAISSDDGDKEPSEKEEDDDGKKEEVQRPVANKNNNITGTWVYNIDLSDAVATKMVEELGMDIAPDTALYMNLTLQFDDGNAFTLAAELDRDSFEAYFNDLLVAMIDVMYEMAEEQGMSRSEFDAQIQAQFGMSLEDYMSSMVDELVDEGFDEFPNETISGYYRVEDDCLYIAEYEDELEDTTRYMVYELSGNTLTIERIVEDGEEITDPMELEEFGIQMPWEFEKD